MRTDEITLQDLNADQFIEEKVKEISSIVGSGTAINALSGGVDSSSRSISEPSFVLRMLDMLRLESGHRVFELGAGSGWNAALIGNIVGPSGHVYSLEIIPELAKQASETIEKMGIKTVSIINKFYPHLAYK